jgi:hypothetical protein
MTELDLRFNELTADDGARICGAAAAAGMTRLKTLDLSNNPSRENPFSASSVVGCGAWRQLNLPQPPHDFVGIADCSQDFLGLVQYLMSSDRAAFVAAYHHPDLPPELLKRIESIRLEAGRMMGFGDVTDSVIPKVGLLSEPRGTGAITSRYLTPHALHAAHAVTGACCVATACAVKGSIAYEFARMPEGNPRTVWIEHPTGMVDVRLETTGEGKDLQVVRAGILRTCRPIMKGEVYVPVD